MDTLSPAWTNFGTDVLVLLVAIFYLATSYIEWSEFYQTGRVSDWPESKQYIIVGLVVLITALGIAAFALYPQ